MVDTYRFPGFDIVQFNLPVLSRYSYLLVSGPEALLVDPDRDINAYLDYAKKNNLTIKGDDDDMVTEIERWRVGGLVFALEQSGCHCRNPAEHLLLRVDDMPPSLRLS